MIKFCRSDGEKEMYCVDEWKEIPGFDGLYEASYWGEIRRIYGWPPTKDSGEITYRVLKQTLCRRRNGGKYDAMVSLKKDGKWKPYRVARLVAMTWCEGYKPGMTVDHFNGDTLNNCVENLEWVTMKTNIQRAKHSSYAGGANRCKPCKLVRGDGMFYQFDSYRDASLFLKREKDYIHSCLRRGTMARSKKGEKYRIEV